MIAHVACLRWVFVVAGFYPSRAARATGLSADDVRACLQADYFDAP
jgi:hypothetical protein